MEKKSSKGVIIFSTLIFIFFLFSLLVFFTSQRKGIDGFFSSLMIVICPATLIGVLSLKRWGRILALCLSSSMVAFFSWEIISAIFASDETRAWFPLILIVFLPFVLFGISCIYFFTRSKVKEQFN